MVKPDYLAQMTLQNTPIDQIMPTPLFQWRQVIPQREALEASIKTHGIIQPLIAFDQGGQIFLLDGYERLAIVQSLGHTEIPLQILNFSLHDAFILRLTLNQGPWNAFELSHILNKATQLMDDSALAIKIAPLLKIASSQQIKDLKKLYEIPLTLKQQLSHIPLNTLLKILDFSDADQKNLAILFNGAHMNQNKLGEILDVLITLCKKNNDYLSQLLITYKDMLPLNHPEKIELLRQSLKTSRNPLYEAKKAQWEQLKQKVKAPSFMQLDTTPYFESGELIVNARVKSDKELNQLREIIVKMEFKELLDFLKN